MNTISTIIETGTVTYTQTVLLGCLFCTLYIGAYFVSWLSGRTWRWIDDIPSKVFVHHPLLMLNLKIFNVGKLEYNGGCSWKQYGTSYQDKGVYRGVLVAACIFIWPGALLFLLLPITILLAVNNLAVVGVAVLAVGTIWLARTARRTHKTLKSHIEDLAVHKKTK